MKVGFGLAYHAAVVIRTRSRIGKRLASSVTIENSASRQDVVRGMALSDHCRWVSTPRCAHLLVGARNVPTLHEPRHDLRRRAVAPATIGSERLADHHAAEWRSRKQSRWTAHLRHTNYLGRPAPGAAR